MKKPKLHCLYDRLLSPDDLLRNPKNNNKHSGEQIERLAKILEYQGFRYPIKVSKRSGFITSGHARLEAAILNGYSKVPVNFQDYDSEDQEYADLTADNSIALWAELDFSKINSEIDKLGSDFDLDLLGLKNFNIQSTEFIDSINSADTAAEWVDLDKFEAGSNYIKLTYIFGSEEERKLFCQKNNLSIDKKFANQWLIYPSPIE